MLTSMLHSVAILGGVGLVFAVFIALAYWKLRVWEDPRIDVVASMLPGANCGACGLPGCRGFAEQAVAGKIQPAACNVIDAEGASVIASYLGVDAGQANKKVARLLCAGGSNVAVQLAEYRGLPTCGAAAAVAGGGKGCAWGCLGFGDCAVRHECALNLSRSESMSAYINNIIDPAHYPEITVRVAPRTIAREVYAVNLRPVLLFITIVVAPDRS